jgi:hypothetical protein
MLVLLTLERVLHFNEDPLDRDAEVGEPVVSGECLCEPFQASFDHPAA